MPALDCETASARCNSQSAQISSAPKSAQVATTLAAAHAETRQFVEALEAAQRARTLATAPEQAPLAEALRKQTQLYGAGSPYRE